MLSSELHNTLALKQVHDKDFPGETLRVLGEKEIKQFGDYLTQRLMLEAWDKLARNR